MLNPLICKKFAKFNAKKQKKDVFRQFSGSGESGEMIKAANLAELPENHGGGDYSGKGIADGK